MCQRRAWLGITSHASNHQAGAEKVLPNAESRRAQIFLALLSVAVAFATLAARFSQLLMKSSPTWVILRKHVSVAADHFCGKLLGVPMGCDVCYTNHAEADQDDMDALLTLLSAAGVSFVIAVPGADDVMLNYQSLAFHDILYVRQTLGRRCAPEFEDWLQWMGLADADGRLLEKAASGAIGPAIALIEAMEA
jgi:ethanolamine ammonia-lyase large subunit